MAQHPPLSLPSLIDASAIAQLLAGERIPRPSACSDDLLTQLGLAADAQKAWLVPGFEPLDEDTIRGSLTSQSNRTWAAFELSLLSTSTNAELVALGAGAEGRWLATEYQHSGRGRRGRSWLSPVGRNIAVSFGWAQAGSLADMGGLSLVVGMAVVDALRTLGLSEVALKWPNDLIVLDADGGYAKLGGILVELQHQPNRALAVIGIGLNMGGAGLLDAAVDQPLADISQLQGGIGRNRVLAAVVNALADYLAQFEQVGFVPMVEVFDALHAFTGRTVDVVSAGQRQTGRVLGVAPGGELRLSVQGATEIHLDAGEVSLRSSQASSSTLPVLDIDLGNSALKYRAGAAVGRVPYAVAAGFQLPPLARVTRVRVASVLTAARDAEFAALVQAQWNCECEFAKSAPEVAGVTNGYSQPEALGVDRWLAAVAGFHHVRGAVLVVDLGTAATLDYVDERGRHLGGYIVPGTQLMCRTLLQETAAVRFEEAAAVEHLLPGKQTRDAVERGAIVAMVQLIHAELERFDQLCDHGAKLVLCGGGVAAIERHLKCDYRVIPELVLDGLALALP